MGALRQVIRNYNIANAVLFLLSLIYIVSFQIWKVKYAPRFYFCDMGANQGSVDMRSEHDGDMQPESLCKLRGSLSVVGIFFIYLNAIVNCGLIHKWHRDGISFDQSRYGDTTADKAIMDEAGPEGARAQQDSVVSSYIQDYDVQLLGEAVDNDSSKAIVGAIQEHFSEHW